jgi:hypothetical protein
MLPKTMTTTTQRERERERERTEKKLYWLLGAGGE